MTWQAMTWQVMTWHVTSKMIDDVTVKCDVARASSRRLVTMTCHRAGLVTMTCHRTSRWYGTVRNDTNNKSYVF